MALIRYTIPSGTALRILTNKPDTNVRVFQIKEINPAKPLVTADDRIGQQFPFGVNYSVVLNAVQPTLFLQFVEASFRWQNIPGKDVWVFNGHTNTVAIYLEDAS